MNHRKKSRIWQLILFVLDGKPSGAILKLGKYDHDYDWSQGEEPSDVIENSSHFQKLRSLKQSGIKGIKDSNILSNLCFGKLTLFHIT